MQEDDALAALSQKIELLCARGDALAREIRRLRAENQTLRGKNDKARAQVRAIMETLPDTPAGGMN